MPRVAGIVAIAPERFGSFGSYGFGVGTFARDGSLFMTCSNPAPNQTDWIGQPDGTPPPVLAQARMLTSGDGGNTWTELHTDNGPQLATAKGALGLLSPIGCCHKDADTLLVAYFHWDYVSADPVQLSFSEFDLVSGTWGAQVTGGPAKANTALADLSVGLSIAFRSLDGAIICQWGDTETVGTPRQRTYYTVYNGAWSAAIPVDAAQTGASADYHFLGCVSGDAGRTHLFYQTANRVNQVTLDSTDTLQAVAAVTVAAAPITFTGPLGFAIPGAPISIAIGYTKAGSAYVSSATSTDVPVFVETLIGLGTLGTILTTGVTATGLCAILLVGPPFGGSGDTASTSADGGTTWTTPAALAYPSGVPIDPNPENSFALFGYNGRGVRPGFLAAGVVANGWKLAHG